MYCILLHFIDFSFQQTEVFYSALFNERKQKDEKIQVRNKYLNKVQQ